MTIDWDQFEVDAEAASQSAKEKTDKELMTKITSITRLEDSDIRQLCPEPGDLERLEELVGIVRSAEADCDKEARIVANAEKFGNIIAKLLKRFL